MKERWCLTPCAESEEALDMPDELSEVRDGVIDICGRSSA